MSSIVNSVKNAFKHPEDQIADASGNAGDSKRSGAEATGNLDPDQTATAGQSGQYTLRDPTSSSNASSGQDNPLQASVPSTGYVGDNTSGRFPGQGQTGQLGGASTGGYSTHSGNSPSSSGSASKQSGIDPNNMTQAERETGREGVPGTVTSGDPSMGGVSHSSSSHHETGLMITEIQFGDREF